MNILVKLLVVVAAQNIDVTVEWRQKGVKFQRGPTWRVASFHSGTEHRKGQLTPHPGHEEGASAAGGGGHDGQWERAWDRVGRGFWGRLDYNNWERRRLWGPPQTKWSVGGPGRSLIALNSFFLYSITSSGILPMTSWLLIANMVDLYFYFVW